jgi:hypothetical protein
MLMLQSKLAKYHDQVLRKADNNIKTNSKLLTTEDDGYESPASRSSSDDSSLNLYDTEIASSGQTVGTTSSRSLSDIIEVKLNMNIFKKQMEAWGPGAFIRMCDKMSRMSKIVSEMRFLHVCRKYKIRLSDAELHSIFSHFDPKSTGFIDAKECLSEIQSVNVDIDALSLQNTVYDRDTDLFRARARLLGKDISPISSISTGSELKDPGLSFSVQNSINSACLSSTLDNNVNVVPDKKVEALQVLYFTGIGK